MYISISTVGNDGSEHPLLNRTDSVSIVPVVGDYVPVFGGTAKVEKRTISYETVTIMGNSSQYGAKVLLHVGDGIREHQPATNVNVSFPR